MLNLSFIDASDVDFEVEFNEISEHIVEIRGDIPHKNCGFYLSRIGYKDMWDYTEYKTIYRVLENGIVQFSNDGSQYIPPVRDVTVSVEWLDDGNIKELRPNSVLVTVYENGIRKNILTLKKQNGWKKVYKNVPEDAAYTLEVGEIKNYEQNIIDTTIYCGLVEEADD